MEITMRKMFLLSIWLFSVRCEDPKIRLPVQEGEVVKIPCPYDSGYEKYPKYFSKGIYSDRKKMKSTDKTFKETTPKGKYSLWDDTKERVLHVTIHYVTLSDAGTYWCEIDAYTFDPKTEIELKVYKAPAHLKPPPVTLNRPVSTTVQTTTRSQKQSRTTVTESISSTPLWTTPPEHVQTGKKLHLAVAAAAAVLLVCLLVVLYLRLRNHRQDEGRVRRAVIPLINTSSTLNNIYGENHSEGQIREMDPPLSTSSSDCVYAVVNSRRGPGAHTSICHPVAVQTRVDNRMSNSYTSESMMCPQEENIYSVSSPSTEARDQHISEDDHLHYSTVSFKTEAAAQSRSQIRSATQPTEVYATVRNTKI